MMPTNTSTSNKTEPIEEECPTTLPNFFQYMLALPADMIIIFILLGILCVLICINYVEELLHLYQNQQKYRPRDKAKWLLAVYPLTACTSLIALVAPATSGLNDMVSSVFIAACVYVFIKMLVQIYGGPVLMMKQIGGKRYKINVPPAFCCCICCPTPILTGTTVQVLYAMILQFALIRPFLGYIIAVMWADGSFGPSGSTNASPATYISYVYMLSTIMAIWSFGIVFQFSKKPLHHVHIRPKFFCLQLTLIIIGLQRGIISFFIISQHITCVPPLHAEAVADRWNHMIIIVEMFVIAIVARVYYRHKKYRRIPDVEKAGDDECGIENVATDTNDSGAASSETITIADTVSVGTTKLERES